MKKLPLIFLLSFFMGSIVSWAQTGAIRINQQGYYPGGSKIALVANCPESHFEILQLPDSSKVFEAPMSASKFWGDAGDHMKHCDFSSLSQEGLYVLHIPAYGYSYPFEISGTAWRQAAYASLKSYYYQRASFELEEEYAGLWAREAGHPDTLCYYHPDTGKEGTMSSPKGWYDAGDYGKYVVNAGISVGSMLSFHESFSQFFGDSTISIPESGNGISDLLDEMRYELDWLVTMQDEDGGVFHKLTTKNFIGFVMPEDATQDRYVMPKSTEATLDFTSLMAMAGRIYADVDPDFATSCIARAKAAWAWAKAHPTDYFKNPSDVNTGQYGTSDGSDEFIWAAAELYITTGEDEFQTYLTDRSSMLKYNGTPGWPNVQPLASLSLATVDNGLAPTLLGEIRSSIVRTADRWLNEIAASPARIPSHNYYWGSNSGMANMGIGLLYAHMISGEDKYIQGAAECADYILGKNAMGFSFMTLYGYRTPMYIHHRPSGADEVDQPIPGFVAGGPNGQQQDKAYYPFDIPAKDFADEEPSYASNEICINWNSPLTVLLAGVDAVLGDSSQVDFVVPRQVNNPPEMRIFAPARGSKILEGKPVLVSGAADDPDGIQKIEVYLDAVHVQTLYDASFEYALEDVSLGDHTVTVLAFDPDGLCSGLTHHFTLIPIVVSDVPGRVEAENYSDMSGIVVQASADDGGGKEVTAIQKDDWFQWTVKVEASGNYAVDFRIARPIGSAQLQLLDQEGTVLSDLQSDRAVGEELWMTIRDTIALNSGEQVLRINSLSFGWKMNWADFFPLATGLDEKTGHGREGLLTVIPNPVRDLCTVTYQVSREGPVKVTLLDVSGKLIREILTGAKGAGKYELSLDMASWPAGLYILQMEQNGSIVDSRKILK